MYALVLIDNDKRLIVLSAIWEHVSVKAIKN
jgi:hypothetical protein